MKKSVSYFCSFSNFSPVQVTNPDQSWCVRIAEILIEKCEDFVFHISDGNLDALTGVALGVAYNAANYVVQVGGRSSNIVNIFDKNSMSSLGKPQMALENRPATWKCSIYSCQY